ncbi:hydrolase [Aliiglaciecola lipolytica]|uniref:hydrolase n=1 Tax=Aliiglaciecola lipolytica TaxID=477689 RepID=UPI001C097427|nr:hydrolase [Aliiglaciecola lipolytica]MBU2877516.1 hydrolase [Aliiglaciecola lipolytica]
MNDKYKFATEANKNRIKRSDFKAPFWAKNRHVQTLWPRFIQRRRPLALRVEKLKLPDSDSVKVVWGQPESQENNKGIAVLFHGLEGSVKSHYANDLMAELQSQGWQTVLMHFRGCGGELNTTPRAYHSGETEDASYFMAWLDKKFPDLPKVAIGFSLGANMLLKFLGETPAQKFLKAAVAVSTPFKLAECADSINHGFSKVYQRYLLKSMVKTLRSKMRLIDYKGLIPIDDKKVAKLANFRDFDQNVTAPLHGFADAEDYYQKCSAISFLKHIETPTLVLHSIDDPFMNEAVLPKEHELSDAVQLELSDTGGHVGFLQGTPWKPNIWFHKRISDFIAPFSIHKGVKE